MVRRDRSFQAVLNEVRQVGTEWVLDTSRGTFVTAGPVKANAHRLASGATYGHTYQVALNRDEQIRYIRRLYR